MYDPTERPSARQHLHRITMLCILLLYEAQTVGKDSRLIHLCVRLTIFEPNQPFFAEDGEIQCRCIATSV